ncbi:hypothetical protein PR202_gb17090 [Eleusine coracana subsp. coracana]|uniref:C-terminal processing peptidase n=1 Tax=Eleusine coracana subsp. coracana TaxID=191504 RepID=A0AAV5F249_ELECO|nr:hypothetical protein PR202_gb17090 [Eleusine coracana subsp. coracana]
MTLAIGPAVRPHPASSSIRRRCGLGKAGRRKRLEISPFYSHMRHQIGVHDDAEGKNQVQRTRSSVTACSLMGSCGVGARKTASATRHYREIALKLGDGQACVTTMLLCGIVNTQAGGRNDTGSRRGFVRQPNRSAMEKKNRSRRARKDRELTVAANRAHGNVGLFPRRRPAPAPRRVRRPPSVLAGRASLRVRSERREQPPAIRASGLEHAGRSLGQAAAGLAAAAVVSLTGFAGDVSPLPPAPARAESLTVAFPVSKAREVNRVQRTLVEAWGLIRETFVDPTFNHQDWDQKLQQTMVEMFPLKSEDAAYNKIRGMLSTLGDPFTKIITPKEYQSFRIGSDGNVQGVGVFINREPSSGRLLVMDCIEGGPADRAGIREGDELVEIDGKSVFGLDGEAAAQRLRGHVGTTVKVKLLEVFPYPQHLSPSCPKLYLICWVHSFMHLLALKNHLYCDIIESCYVIATENKGSGKSRQKEVQIAREVINLSPLSTTIISHRSNDGQECKTGYVRLAAFSQTAAAEMENAIKRMEDDGVQSYILDLRNNPGGLVKAGLDVAQIWLDGDETLVNTVDRSGDVLPINMTHGHSLTHDPLVILVSPSFHVNEGSASASEILAGALHDNGRAILVGHRTFGKGKIQAKYFPCAFVSVTELDDGSALFITVAKYLSPALHEIDQVGIQPDIQCSPDVLSLPRAPSLRGDGEASSLETDSCIMVAEQALEIEQTKGSAS